MLASDLFVYSVHPTYLRFLYSPTNKLMAGFL